MKTSDPSREWEVRVEMSTGSPERWASSFSSILLKSEGTKPDTGRKNYKGMHTDALQKMSAMQRASLDIHTMYLQQQRSTLLCSRLLHVSQ